MASSVHHAPNYSRNIHLPSGVLVSPIRNYGNHVLSPVRKVPVMV
jgi:hypothetical protein